MPKPEDFKQERFVRLPHSWLNSPAYKDLHPQAVCILIELLKRYYGSNNGGIGLSCREAAKVAHCGKSTAMQRLKQLEAHGFIKMNNKGCYGNRHSTTWILTTERYNHQNATHDWKRWQPKKC